MFINYLSRAALREAALFLYPSEVDAVEHEKHDIEQGEDDGESQDVLLVAYQHVDEEHQRTSHQLQDQCRQIELGEIGGR